MKKTLALLILAALFVLSGCDQPQTPAEKPAATTAKSTIIAARVEGTSPWTVALALDPPQPKMNQETRFRFAVTGQDGKPAAGLQANVALVMPVMDMGKNEFPAKETAPGAYEGSGRFTMGDEWEVFLTLAQGKTKARHVFNVRVAE